MHSYQFDRDDPSRISASNGSSNSGRDIQSAPLSNQRPHDLTSRSSSAVSYQDLFQKGFQHVQQNGQSAPMPDMTGSRKSKQAIKANSAVLNRYISKLPDHKRVKKEPNSQTSETDDFENYLSGLDPSTTRGREIRDTGRLHEEREVINDHKTNVHQVESFPGMINRTQPQTYLQSTSSIASNPHHLMLTSDKFMQLAHSNVQSSVGSRGALDYFKCIKLAIKALVVLIKKYSHGLDPQLESTVYYKLAKIYFTETRNINRAEDYASKAISVSSRNNLIHLRFMSEFLGGQILEVVNRNLLTNYLNEKIQNYTQMGYSQYSDLFLLLKINISLTSDISTGLVTLQSISRSANVSISTRLLCLLYQSNLHLYRGSPTHADADLKVVEQLLAQFETTIPTQFKAMAYLLRYLNYIQTNNVILAKDFMQKISGYLQAEQSKGWANWNEDGSIIVQIVEGTKYDRNGIIYRVPWLTSDEFVIMFYFLTGVSLLTEVSNGKRKSKKVFEKCLQIVEKQLKEITQSHGGHSSRRTISIRKLGQITMRLKFVKYNINYYQAWMGFLNNEFGAIKYLNEFMTEYNNGNFSNDELFCFNLLLPKIYYLFGLYYQFKGDIQASKYYYLKVRNSTFRNTADAQQNTRSRVEAGIDMGRQVLGIFSQTIRGTGQFSELFVYSTLHLLMLAEYEVREISKASSDKSNDFISEYFQARGRYLQDLTQALTPNHTSNSFSLNFTSSSDVLKLTYHVLLHIFNDTASSGDQIIQQKKVNTILLQQMSQSIETFQDSTSFPFITNLIHYLIYIGTDNMDQKTIYFKKCMSMISIASASDNDRIMSIFVLRGLIQHFKESGENDKANMAELQLGYFHSSVAAKFEFLKSNLDNK